MLHLTYHEVSEPSGSSQLIWEPAELFNDPLQGDRQAFALVVLNVPLENLTVVKKLARSGQLIPFPHSVSFG